MDYGTCYILSAEGGEVLLGEAVHAHQVDVRVLLPLELLAAHVTRPVHVELHVGVKLNVKKKQ